MKWLKVGSLSGINSPVVIRSQPKSAGRVNGMNLSGPAWQHWQTESIRSCILSIKEREAQVTSSVRQPGSISSRAVFIIVSVSKERVTVTPCSSLYWIDTTEPLTVKSEREVRVSHSLTLSQS